MSAVSPFRIGVPDAVLADQGLFGQKGSKEFARSPDWRIEADRILKQIKSAE